MKLLHINSYYGGGMFYKNLYDKQIDDGLNIDVYVPTSITTNLSNLELGDYTTVSKNHGKYDRILFHIKHRKIYKDIIKKYEINNYSIIHAHSLFSNGYIALNLKRDFGVPYIVAVRNADINLFFKKMIHLRKLGVQILKEAESVIFLSEPYKNFVVEKYVPNKLKKEIFDKSEVIPNGIDEYWLKNKGIPKVYTKRENLNLVYVGAINKNKNLTTTVKAIEMLQQKGYNVKFTVVGKIADKSIYQEIIKSPYVSYIEPKTKEKLIEIYRSNSIFIMPSITETFGLVYAEAMSQGLPVIYSKGQGFDGQFEEGKVGYRVECLNPVDIVDRIIDAVNNYELLSKNCIGLSDEFNWTKIAYVYSKVYELHNKR